MGDFSAVGTVTVGIMGFSYITAVMKICVTAVMKNNYVTAVMKFFICRNKWCQQAEILLH